MSKLPAVALWFHANPRWDDEARRSTWMLWPPMPAPPTLTASTFVASEELTVWVATQVDADARSCAVSMSAESLEATSDRPVWRAVTAALRRPRRAVFCCSISINFSTIAEVSTPEAMPVSPSMGMGVSLQLRVAAHHAERFGRRDRADDASVEVLHLDDHAPRLLIHLEVQLTVVLGQL